MMKEAHKEKRRSTDKTWLKSWMKTTTAIVFLVGGLVSIAVSIDVLPWTTQHEFHKMELKVKEVETWHNLVATQLSVDIAGIRAEVDGMGDQQDKMADDLRAVRDAVLNGKFKIHHDPLE